MTGWPATATPERHHHVAALQRGEPLGAGPDHHRVRGAGVLRPAQHPLPVRHRAARGLRGHQDRRAGARQDGRRHAVAYVHPAVHAHLRLALHPGEPAAAAEVHVRQAARAVRHAPPPGRGLAGVHRRGRDEVPAAQHAQRAHSAGGARRWRPRTCLRSCSTCCSARPLGSCPRSRRTADPSNLPKFQYTNLRATFEGLFRGWTACCARWPSSSPSPCRWSPARTACTWARLEDERLPRCTHFILAVTQRRGREADRRRAARPVEDRQLG